MSKKFKDLGKAIDKTLKRAKKEVKSKLMRELAEELQENIIKRTRLGYGVDEYNTKRSKLDKLSTKYEKFRSRNKSKLSNKTTPKKSNLTLTGEMVDNTKVKAKGMTLHLDVEGGDNQDKAEWNAEKGRSFLNFSSTDVKYIGRKIREFLKEMFR